MGQERELYAQLHKLSGLINPEEELQHILSTLWRTRKTGLSASDKSHLHSLLNLPNGLDPVLACLRSLIRKCARENAPVNDMVKLFPPDLPHDLRSALLTVFEKCQTQWKEDICKDQNQLSRTNSSLQISAGLLQPFPSFPTSEIAASCLRWKDGHASHYKHNKFGSSTPIITDINVSQLSSMSLLRDVGTDDLGTLPRLKSMTWTLDNRSKTPAGKVAVISLKLQDYTKSPSGETEVKFQLTRDTVDAMLNSMTYINEQLSSYVGSSSGTAQKKQRH